LAEQNRRHPAAARPSCYSDQIQNDPAAAAAAAAAVAVKPERQFALNPRGIP